MGSRIFKIDFISYSSPTYLFNYLYENSSYKILLYWCYRQILYFLTFCISLISKCWIPVDTFSEPIGIKHIERRKTRVHSISRERSYFLKDYIVYTTKYWKDLKEFRTDNYNKTLLPTKCNYGREWSNDKVNYHS